LITTESQFSPPHLQQGVTVDSGELFSKTLKDSPFLQRDNEEKMDYPCRVLLTKNISKESKIWVS
jgi:hypothetical protein